MRLVSYGCLAPMCPWKGRTCVQQGVASSLQVYTDYPCVRSQVQTCVKTRGLVVSIICGACWQDARAANHLPYDVLVFEQSVECAHCVTRTPPAARPR